MSKPLVSNGKGFLCEYICIINNLMMSIFTEFMAAGFADMTSTLGSKVKITKLDNTSIITHAVITSKMDNDIEIDYQGSIVNPTANMLIAKDIPFNIQIGDYVQEGSTCYLVISKNTSPHDHTYQCDLAMVTSKTTPLD